MTAEMGDPAANAETEALDYEAIREQLGPFFSNNAEASFTTGDTGASQAAIASPWGDASVVLGVRSTDAGLIAALNSVRLPARFSAIWHLDTRDFEVIFTTALADKQLYGRSFTFRYDGSAFLCEFAPASDRLLRIADAFILAETVSDTNYRNLVNFLPLRMLEQLNQDDTASLPPPISFWIRKLDCDENQLVDLASVLNFNMHYFDRRTPRILIHDASPPKSIQNATSRYPTGSFPPELIGRDLDPYLLSLWSSALSGSPRLQFLYCYQILEYAAFYYVKEETRQVVRRILVKPESYVNTDEAVRLMVDAISEDRVNDDQKIQNVIQQLVDPQTVWREIELQKSSFSSATLFEGGFQLSAFIEAGWGLNDFSKMWIPKYPFSLRMIRNALVHAREQRMTTVIAPTTANDERLRPWIPAITATAMQVILGLGISR